WGANRGRGLEDGKGNAYRIILHHLCGFGRSWETDTGPASRTAYARGEAAMERGEGEEGTAGSASSTQSQAAGGKTPLKVAVVGFGMMGRQIPQVFLQNGHHVTVTDENLDMLKPGVEEIENGPYGIKAAISRGKLTEEQAASSLRNLGVAEN